MPFADEIARAALEATRLNVGATYGPAVDLSPGAGLIFSGLRYAIFNADAARYQARRGSALILTHECDIDQANPREFNEEFVFLPLMLVSEFAHVFDVDDGTREQGKDLARNIGAGRVTRMAFLPPYPGEIELGAFLYFNAISSSHITQLARDDTTAFCALTAHGMESVDRWLHNHLFRPKAERLPLTPT